MTLLVLGVVLVTAFVPDARGVAYYLPLHSLLECVSVVIAVMVFSVAWNAYRLGLTANILLISCGFLGVGMLDFSHMISFAGMYTEQP